MNSKEILIAGVLMIAATILLDAFGAHGLKKLVSSESIDTYRIGTKYLGITGLGFCLLGLILKQYAINARWILVLWTLGGFLFSGSLFILCFKSSIPPSILSVVGPLTPIGGVLMIAGWLILSIKLIQWKN